MSGQMHSSVQFEGLRGAADVARGVLAYVSLALGVAGTAAIAPLIVVGLAARGFH